MQATANGVRHLCAAERLGSGPNVARPRDARLRGAIWRAGKASADTRHMCRREDLRNAVRVLAAINYLRGPSQPSLTADTAFAVTTILRS